MSDYPEIERKMQKTCDALTSDLGAIRAGRANTAVLNPITVSYYGVDTPTEEELLCSHRTLEEACKAINADSLGYLSCEGATASSFGCSDLCLACFNGNYPTALYQLEYEQDEEE